MHGDPHLAGSGPLTAASAGALALDDAAGPGALAVLLVSLDSVPAPFKGGTLLPVPILLEVPLATVGNPGDVTLAWSSWPAGLSGASLYFQFAVQDAAAPKGVALSNGLRADVP